MTAPRGSRLFMRSGATVVSADFNTDAVVAATREEIYPIAMGAVLLGFMALIVCFTRGYLLLYGDAVAHLGIARRILDARNPGLVQLGGVWLPLPHLLMLPFVGKMEWWQNGLAGAWPSLVCYVFSVVGLFRLARRMLAPRWALVATALYALNPNLLYLATTAMTEPLFLALVIWLALVTIECVEAIRAEQSTEARRRLLALGVLIFAAVFTRYDGWIVGAAVWCIVAWTLLRAPAMRRRVGAWFAVFTILAVSGPLLWLWYNQHFCHDPLDFMRGPYSAPAIEKRTSPPGSKHYRGWHNPGWALLFYTRTAQIDAAAWETGFALLLASLAGLWIALRKGIARASVLLWLPLPFYVYSVAYGSVPIFIPELYPHSFYNARYGMEMLPALALFAAVAASAWEQRRVATNTGAAKSARPLYLICIALAVVNALGLVYATTWTQKITSLIEHRPSTVLARYDQPLVLKEAMVNSTTRIPFERNLAVVLEDLPAGAPILMATSDHIGAIEDAGIALKQMINESDYDSWQAALAAPASHAAYIVAMTGDPVASAVEAHPEGLVELTILCGTGQPCARLYQSDRYTQSDRYGTGSTNGGR